MFLIVIFLPLISACICSIFGRFLGKFGVMIITTFNMWICSIYSLRMLLILLTTGESVFVRLGTWIDIGEFNVDWGFQLDSLSAVMLFIVTTIAALIHTYSLHYMKNDPFIARFFTYLSFFAFFMLILVTADNFIILFVGWEGIGLCSYLLINFWYTRLQANKSAIKAIIINRIGDFCLLIAMGLIYSLAGSLDFSVVFSVVNFINLNGQYQSILDCICLFLFLGAVGKSAQLGLHVWLPDAMEGPTPVSALIHAATMVTAGIFLIIRCSFIFENSPVVLSAMVLIGCATAFVSASLGLVQFDIKKIIAYSTCSQLGYMMMVCGLSQYAVSFFHLFNHAFFKALLFLTAGSIIHSLSDEQDIRKMGGLATKLNFFYTSVLIGSLSLIGFPFSTGFYSKDLILEIAGASYSIEGSLIYWVGTLSACLTAAYSFRLIYYIFLTRTNASHTIIKSAHGPVFIEGFVLSILAFASIIIGYVSRDYFVGLGSDFFANTVYVDPLRNTLIDSEFLPVIYKLLPVLLSLISILIAYLTIRFFISRSRLLYTHNFIYKCYCFLISKWNFDTIYNFYIARSLLKQGKPVFKTWDKWILERLRFWKDRH